jgi:hypothetical protein
MRLRITALGWVTTAVIWPVAILVAFGTLMGDCAPVAGVTCPTGDSRVLTMLAIIAGAALLNAALIALISLPGRDGR